MGRARFDLESELEGKVVRWAKRHGLLTLKLYNAGDPDRVFLIPHGEAVFVEFKRLGEVPAPLQQYMLTKLNDMGFLAIWSDNYEEIVGFLEHRIRFAEAARLPKTGRGVAS